MNQLTIILILVLASTNATKYLHPIHHFPQDQIKKALYQEESDLSSTFNEDQHGGSLPQLTSLGELQGWDSVPDPRFYVLTELESPGGTNQGDLRVKRKGPSLSIVNPLDVLRQRLLIEMARRQKAESLGKIQKNREILSSLGKRSIFSARNTQYEDFAEEESEKDRPTRSINSNEKNPTTRRYQNWKNDFSYQT